MALQHSNHVIGDILIDIQDIIAYLFAPKIDFLNLTNLYKQQEVTFC